MGRHTRTKKCLALGAVLIGFRQQTCRHILPLIELSCRSATSMTTMSTADTRQVQLLVLPSVQRGLVARAPGVKDLLLVHHVEPRCTRCCLATIVTDVVLV